MTLFGKELCGQEAAAAYSAVQTKKRKESKDPDERAWKVNQGKLRINMEGCPDNTSIQG